MLTLFTALAIILIFLFLIRKVSNIRVRIILEIIWAVLSILWLWKIDGHVFSSLWK